LDTEKSVEHFFDVFESPVGTLYLIFSGKFLVRISFEKPARMQFKNGAAPREFIGELKGYFEKGRDNFKQKIKFSAGTEFERKVWLLLREIPFGETKTYKWLAERIGKPNACRAVGQALKRNPIHVMLPCHRIIESNGSIGGYSSRVDIKRRLLEMEYYLKTT